MDRYLLRARNTIHRCAGELTLEQLTGRVPGKWTIAEILEHLSRAFSGTTAGIQRILSAGRPAARPPDLGDRFRTFVVVECGYLPAGRPAPKATIPLGIEPSTALLLATETLEKMDGALGEAAARFGTGVKLMDHPILGPLSIRQWRRFHWVHTRHHARQITARIARSQHR